MYIISSICNNLQKTPLHWIKVCKWFLLPVILVETSWQIHKGAFNLSICTPTLQYKRYSVFYNKYDWTYLFNIFIKSHKICIIKLIKWNITSKFNLPINTINICLLFDKKICSGGSNFFFTLSRGIKHFLAVFKGGSDIFWCYF